jgi:hypothetical protein
LYQYQPPKRRGGRKALIWILSILVLLVALDFGGKAFAESEAATQIQKQGFPKKPNVSIAGFPFLTQVITRNFNQITISSSNIPEGPVKITSLDVVAEHVHLNSNFQSGTAGPLHGTVLISLGQIGGFISTALGFLGGGGGSGGGLKVVSVGSSEVKGSGHISVAGFHISGSAVWKVTSNGPNSIDLRLVSSSLSGLPGSINSHLNNIKLPLSKLPAGLTLTGNVTTSGKGITAHVFARSLSFGS